MSVKERMMQAVAASGAVGAYESIVDACVDVATNDNRKLLDMLKAKNAEIDRSETEHTPGSLVALGYRPTFAAMAMQGLCNDAMHISQLADDGCGGRTEDRIARRAVRCADALIAALEAKS